MRGSDSMTGSLFSMAAVAPFRYAGISLGHPARLPDLEGAARHPVAWRHLNSRVGRGYTLYREQQLRRRAPAL
jgi:hypothetical protein